MGDARIIAAIGVLALLAACGREPSAAEKEARDLRDIAQVEAAQKLKPPPRPISPQPILFADIDRYDLFGAGCGFAPGASIGAVMLARSKAAWLKLDDRLIRFASDPGSARMPLGTWSRYTGKALALALTRADGAGEADGSEAVRWRGRLTVTDAFGQVVFDAPGLVQCGA